MKINVKSKQIKLTQADKEFKEFVEEGDEFEITLITLTTRESLSLASKANEKDKEDGGAEGGLDILQEFADVAIVDWKGLTDSEGREVKFSKGNLKNLVEYSPEFVSAIFEAYQDRVLAIETNKKK